MQESCRINCKQEAQVLFRLDRTVLSPIYPFSGPSNISSPKWTVTQPLRGLKFRCVLYTYLHQSTKITGQRTTVTTADDSLFLFGMLSLSRMCQDYRTDRAVPPVSLSNVYTATYCVCSLHNFHK